MAKSSTASRITIGLTDDHQVLTEALSAMLGAAPDLEVLFTAADCAGLRTALMEHCPHVLVLDVGLPDGDGIDMLPEVYALCAQTAVLVLTSMGDEGTLHRALDAGVAGFMPKRQSLGDLQDSIRKAAAGEMVVPGSLLKVLLSRRRRRSGRVTTDTASLLTTRERQILELLVQGRTGTEIAAALTISPATVRTHIGNLLSKMNVHSRLQAVAYAVSHGFLERTT